MLLRFTVSNFLSFNNEQEFSMNVGTATTYDHRITKTPEQDILKFAAIYGANASGKSNLVKAIDFSKSIIKNGINEITYTDYHYKLDPNNKIKPSKFEFDLMIDGKYYGYGFSVNLDQKKILNEWLVELKKDEDLLIFERDSETKYSSFDIKFKNKDEEARFEFQLEDVNDIENTLLISEITRRKNNPEEMEIIEKIHTWFTQKLVIIYPHSVIENMTKIFKDSETALVKLLEYFDTGICGYVLEESSFDQIKKYMPQNDFDKLKGSIETFRDRIANNKFEEKKISVRGRGVLILDNHLFEMELDRTQTKLNEILFKHNGNKDITFAFGEESDGTRRLIELLDVIYSEDNDRTVIIDELDRSLHPQMTIKFAETFLKISEKNKTQLIITTHESNLMDLKLLRRDEIWFVERDPGMNESILYSLEKFKVHNTKKVAKDYLIGRYGAVPVFKDFDSYIGDKDGNSEI